ncbi:MAG: ANTAR domain-containing protein [Oceanospirillaceae bacterium]|nr:ANTAR domain-containing protein [Oceanospirillaceae bacterium]MBT7330852.1 ANTAR domain-containing protein [Oceanospirillaceae bacterium]
MKPNSKTVRLVLDQHTPSTPIALAIESCGYQCKTTQWGQLMSSTAHLSDTLVIAQLEMSVQQLEYITHHIDCTNHATLIMLTRGDDATIESLVNADVSLLHVGPLSHERIPSLLKVAMARHTSSLRKQQHVKQLQSKLHDLKLVNRAKGKLMQQQGISEKQAHATMQKLAMARGQTLGELAQAILTS